MLNWTVVPARNNETRDCQVTIKSTSIEQPNIDPMVTEETIHIKAVSLFQRVILPTLMSLLLMVVAIFLIGVIAYFAITTDTLAQPFTWG